MPLRRDIPLVASIENISEIPIDLFEIFKMQPKEVIEIDFSSLIERIANRVWDAAQNGAAGGVLKVTVVKSRIKEPPKPDNAPEPEKPADPPKAPDAPPVKTPEPAAPPVPAPAPEAPAPAAAPEVPAPAAEPVKPDAVATPVAEPPKHNPLAAFMKPAKKK